MQEEKKYRSTIAKKIYIESFCHVYVKNSLHPKNLENCIAEGPDCLAEHKCEGQALALSPPDSLTHSLKTLFPQPSVKFRACTFLTVSAYLPAYQLDTPKFSN